MIEPNHNPTTGRIDPVLIRTAITQARQSACQIDDLRAANSCVIKTLESALNQTVNGVLNGPLSAAENNAAHRRAHRKGVLSRIASDPELETFIRARINALTFSEIVKEIHATFPPSRQTSLSAISRWWRANRHDQARLAPAASVDLS